jgi:hypothetical protein
VWVKDIRFPGPEWLGISRFDGSAWTSYPVEEVLPSDRLGVPKDAPDRGSLWTTVAGADGDVWVGGCGGISHFVDGVWTSYPSAELGLNNVMSIAVADGTVWIGGEGIGAPAIARFDGTTWDRVEQGVAGNGDEYQYTTVVAAGGQIWAAVNGALLRWDGETFLQVVGADRPQEITSPMVAVDRDELWTGDWSGGAWRLLGDQWTHFDDRADLPGELHDLTLAPDGTLWATTKKGVWRFDGSRWEETATGDYRAIAFAPDGQPWAAGSVPGTVVPRETAIGPVGGATLPTPAPLDPFGFRFVVAAADDVWAGSPGSWGIGAGLAHFDGTEWTRVTPVEGQPYFAVSGIEIAPNGDVWVSLVIFDPSEPNAPDPIVVARFDGSSWQIYRDASGVSFGTLQRASGRLDLAPDGTPVLAAPPGLVKFRDGAWTLLQEGWFEDFSTRPTARSGSRGTASSGFRPRDRRRRL